MSTSLFSSFEAASVSPIIIFFHLTLESKSYDFMSDGRAKNKSIVECRNDGNLQRYVVSLEDTNNNYGSILRPFHCLALTSQRLWILTFVLEIQDVGHTTYNYCES